ncbi:MAG: hypothetical protein AAF721_16545 [Myxococcota bacterium]
MSASMHPLPPLRHHLRTGWLLAVPLLLVASACRPAPAADAPPTEPTAPAAAAPEVEVAPVLRTYDAPPGRADELASVLQRVLLRGDEAPLGRATALEGDRVLVVAPDSIHEGVETLCGRMSAKPPSTATSVQLSYWVVLAQPAEAADTAAVPELGSVLDEVVAQMGPAKFSLAERASLTSMLNARGESKGPTAEFAQTVTAREDGVVADLKIDVRQHQGPHAELRTRISLDSGQTAVVGQNGLPGDDGARVFYIVRAELIDGA